MITFHISLATTKTLGNLVFTTNQNNFKICLAHIGSPMFYCLLKSLMSCHWHRRQWWECPTYLNIVPCGPTFLPVSFLSVLVTSVVQCGKLWNSDAVRCPLMRSDVVQCGNKTDRNQLHQILSQSVKGFEFSEGWNFYHSHRTGISLFTQGLSYCSAYDIRKISVFTFFFTWSMSWSKQPH